MYLVHASCGKCFEFEALPVLALMFALVAREGGLEPEVRDDARDLLYALVVEYEARPSDAASRGTC